MHSYVLTYHLYIVSYKRLASLLTDKIFLKIHTMIPWLTYCAIAGIPLLTSPSLASQTTIYAQGLIDYR